jgi:hypothetical protein
MGQLEAIVGSMDHHFDDQAPPSCLQQLRQEVTPNL